MPRIAKSPGLALMWRRLRGRFGISAPQVSVRTRVPWYVRLLGVVVWFAITLTLVAWAYHEGRYAAGFDKSETDQLRVESAVSVEELARLRGLLTASESSLQIERAAQQILTEKNNALVADNSKLKEELAVFERLTKFDGKVSKQDDELVLDQVSIRADVAKGTYRYSFLIALQGARRGKETKFNLQIHLAPKLGQTTDAKVTIPRSEDADTSQYVIVLRNFRRIEGKFSVPAGFEPVAAEIRILETGILKASKTISF